MKEANSDPRRIYNRQGKIPLTIKSLNPGQQCAMRHADGKYWYPYIVVAHDHGIDRLTNRSMPCPGRTIVKLELLAWDVPSHTMVYLIDSVSEDLKLPPLIYAPNGRKVPL